MASTPELMHGLAGKDRYGTPQVVIDLLHKVFPPEKGGFFDPCSDAEANARVGARGFIEANGEKSDWGATRFFVNPPGGKSRLTQKFWDQYVKQLNFSPDACGIWLAFSLDQLQTCLTRPSAREVNSFVVIPRKRLPYYSFSKQAEIGGLRPSALVFSWGHERDSVLVDQCHARFFAQTKFEFPNSLRFLI